MKIHSLILLVKTDVFCSTENLRIPYPVFLVEHPFWRGHGPHPTVEDAAIKAKWLIANGFCRVEVLHPAKKGVK